MKKLVAFSSSIRGDVFCNDYKFMYYYKDVVRKYKNIA